MYTYNIYVALCAYKQLAICILDNMHVIYIIVAHINLTLGACVSTCVCYHTRHLNFMFDNKVPLGFLWRFHNIYIVRCLSLFHSLTSSRWTRDSWMASFHED